MGAVLFRTNRLTVRQFDYGDLDEFAALCADPRVMRYVGDGRPLPRREVERWISVCHEKYARRGYGTSAVFERATGRFVGYCGVVRAPKNDFDELIYVLRLDAWRVGYASEVGRAMVAHVFSVSRLDRIHATIHPENAASVRVVEKLGFRLAQSRIDENGAPVDHYVVPREEQLPSATSEDFATRTARRP